MENNKKSIAICVVAYNRIDGLKRLLSSLKLVDYEDRKDVTLIISIDFSPTNAKIIDFSNSYVWPHGNKKVITHYKNLGLKAHIMECGDYTNEYDILIVLEDDIFVNKYMYKYAYYSACYYFDEEKVAGISLYSFRKNWNNTIYDFVPLKSKSDVYFLKVAQSWGQVWTNKKWEQFKLWYKNNANNSFDDVPNNLLEWSSKTSWLKFHTLYCIKTEKYFVYPYFSFSTNFSDAGTHSKCNSGFSQSNLVYKSSKLCFLPFFDDDSIKYDEYMQNEILYSILNISKNNLTIDLYSTNNKKNNRYILTSRCLNYKIIHQYAMTLRPIELNIINNINGNSIYLYDTTIREKNKKSKGKNNLINYYYGYDNFKILSTLFHFYMHRLIAKYLTKIGGIFYVKQRKTKHKK